MPEPFISNPNLSLAITELLARSKATEIDALTLEPDETSAGYWIQKLNYRRILPFTSGKREDILQLESVPLMRRGTKVNIRDPFRERTIGLHRGLLKLVALSKGYDQGKLISAPYEQTRAVITNNGSFEYMVASEQFLTSEGASWPYGNLDFWRYQELVEQHVYNMYHSGQQVAPRYESLTACLVQDIFPQLHLVIV